MIKIIDTLWLLNGYGDKSQTILTSHLMAGFQQKLGILFSQGTERCIPVLSKPLRLPKIQTRMNQSKVKTT